ncbi:MoaD/ThiS family protein [Verrucomicrobiales bacterium BCK34]|nr:MoaD/ThiS family protein [Verrucomicrobiales bacterium BCK34]
MPKIAFSPNIRSHVDVEVCDVEGDTVRSVLDSVFLLSPRLRGYLLDDNGMTRKHIAVIVNREPVEDRDCLSDPVSESDEIFVMQALSGG